MKAEHKRYGYLMSYKAYGSLPSRKIVIADTAEEAKKKLKDYMDDIPIMDVVPEEVITVIV